MENYFSPSWVGEGWIQDKICGVGHLKQYIPCKIENIGIVLVPQYDKQCATSSGSVTRLGDILDFGQLFKAFGNN